MTETLMDQIEGAAEHSFVNIISAARSREIRLIAHWLIVTKPRAPAQE